MAKRMLIDAAHPEETRVVVLNGHRLDEFDFETSTKKQIKGNIYLAKVTRVEPSLQAAFVEYGGNRHGFLAFNEIHPDYYRIPVADRRAEGFRGRPEPVPSEDAARDDDTAHGEDPLPDAAHSEAGPFEADSGDAAAPEVDWSPLPGDGERAAPAEARDPAVAYETRGPEVIDEAEGEPGTDAPGDAALGGDHQSIPAGQDEHREPSERPGRSEFNGNGPPVEPGVGEEAPSGADAIETVGGDEIEETQRQRVRPYRHYKIQEVIKRRQIMLVQVTKEERGNKGAALTTFLSLAGRYCVLMPNTPRGGGVSRKITNMLDRRRLKDLVGDLEVPEGMGVIVRTAGSERSKAEIKRDFEYLMRLWDDIRELTLKSTAPALIYEEGNLIKRSIRDLYTRDMDEVIVDGEEGHRTAKLFMKMLMPSHAKRIKPYRDPSVPLFHRYQVEGQIDAIHSPIVQLRSGGYIVINPTEALVAIDVNSGRSTKERNIEETALKTNLEAAEEIARQLRLRDLAGLIVIDFIDMEEHRNQAAVERKLKEAMRHDRARIQLGRISPFGLLELSRQRLRPSLLEASTQPCPHCNGTGHIRSIESTALHVLRAIEEEGMRRRSAEISVAVPTAVALYILNQKRGALGQTEARYGLRVAIGNDDTLIPPAFRLERLRALTPAELAALPQPTAAVPEVEEEEEDEVLEEEEFVAETSTQPPAEQRPERTDDDDGHGRRRRRRRRRGRRGDEGREPGPPASPAELAEAARASQDIEGAQAAPLEVGEASGGEAAGGVGEAVGASESSDESAARKRRRRGRRGGRRRRRGDRGPELEAAREPPIEGERSAVAEAVEYVPQPPMREDAGRDMAAAFQAAPLPSEVENGAESVPVSERGDHAHRFEPPAGDPPRADQSTPAPSAASPALSSHEVTGPPPNPKRGWWRRIVESGDH